MPLHISPDRQTGKPPKPAVYAAAFSDKPLHEVMSYWDGKSWGHGANDVQGAMQGLRVGQRLPLFRRFWWVRALYWRVVTADKVSIVDTLRNAR